jgi:hypothetical protein
MRWSATFSAIILLKPPAAMELRGQVAVGMAEEFEILAAGE